MATIPARKERCVCVCLYLYKSLYSFALVSRVVVGGDEGHLADDSGYRLLPHLHLHCGAVLGERRLHVTHGNVLLHAGGGAATGHLTCESQKI